MGCEIKLYAHGVPNGQDTWGVDTYAKEYIGLFYGGKYKDCGPLMVVEVKQTGSVTNCYYTYLRSKNVSAEDGRPGSYVALTIRINMYYADIQNIYNLLEAAYNKFILGNIVSMSGEVTKYKVKSFSQEEKILNSLEEEVQNYLLQFASNSDYMPLNGFKSSGQAEPSRINTLECGVKSVADHVKSNGCICVSSLFPLHREKQLLAQKDAELKSTKETAQQQVEKTKQDAQYEIERVKNAKDKELQDLKEQFKDSDRAIKDLESKLTTAENELKTVKTNFDKAKSDLAKAQPYIGKYESVSKELQDKVELISKLKKVFGEVNNSKNPSAPHSVTPQSVKPKSFFDKFSNWFNVAALFFSLATLVVVLFILFGVQK